MQKRLFPIVKTGQPFFSIINNYHKKKKETSFCSSLSGAEDATRTHNALLHTTFPMWLLTIRIPLHL